MGTSVSMRYCDTTDLTDGFRVSLYRRNWGPIPNQKIGPTVSYPCGGSTWQDYNWGRQQAADYYYRLDQIGLSGGGSGQGSANTWVYY